jgi:hypothetical protein
VPHPCGLGFGFARVGLSFSYYFLVLVHSTICAAAFRDPLPSFHSAGGDVDVEAFHEGDADTDVSFFLGGEPDFVVEIGLLENEGVFIGAEEDVEL